MDLSTRCSYTHDINHIQDHPMRASLDRRRTATGLKLFVRELRRLSGGRVLSVGEGFGLDVVQLAELFPHLRFYAMDLEPDFARRIFERRSRPGSQNVHVVVGDANRLPFRDAAFDFVYGRSVLQFLRGGIEVHAREVARTTRGTIVYRDIANWPWYPSLRWLQAATLRVRGHRAAAETVLHDARLVAAVLAVTKEHGSSYVRRLRDSGHFADVRFIGHDLLWWDLDRELPIVGIFGARFGLRCVVRATNSQPD